MLRQRMAEYGRLLAITIILTSLYLLLHQVWLGLPTLVPVTGFLERPTAAELEKEAKEVAESSKKILQSTPASARHDIWELGFYLGYASQLVGSYAMSADGIQVKARQIGDKILLQANQLSQGLGLGQVTAVNVRTLDDFVRLSERIEADERGIAARVAQAYSRYHRHLFLLGMHLGTESARVESSSGSMSLPPRSHIRRHATVTGVPPALWQPLAAAPVFNEQPAQVLARYRKGLDDLAAHFSSAPPMPSGN